MRRWVRMVSCKSDKYGHELMAALLDLTDFKNDEFVYVF